MIFTLESINATVLSWDLPYKHIVVPADAKFHILFSSPSKLGPVPDAVVKVTVFLSDEEVCFSCENDAIIYKSETHNHRIRRLLMHSIGRAFKMKKIALAPCKESLRTPFEDARLQKESPSPEKSTKKDEKSEEVKAEPPLSINSLLLNVFAAADEDEENVLHHDAMQDLLEAMLIPKGLMKSDIRALMPEEENEDGNITYAPFIENAPSEIECLQERRKAFEAQPRFEPSMPWEEVMSFTVGAEVEETASIVLHGLESYIHANTVPSFNNIVFRLPRCILRQAFEKSKRFTAWEIHLLMQMIPHQEIAARSMSANASLIDTDASLTREKFFPTVHLVKTVLTNDNQEALQHLFLRFRCEVIQNPLVETDANSLQHYFLRRLRQELEPYAQDMSMWQVKRVLMSCDHICLSLFHVHALLCLMEEKSRVDVRHFFVVCMTYIPAFFNGRDITHSAEQQKEVAAAMERGQPDEDEQGEVTNDVEEVQKEILQLFQAQDREGVRGHMASKLFIDLCYQHLPAFGLSVDEIRAFVAHAEFIANEEIAYVEHTKEFLPLIYEFRKCRHLSELLQSKITLLEFDNLDVLFPAAPPAEAAEVPTRRRSSTAVASAQTRMLASLSSTLSSKERGDKRRHNMEMGAANTRLSVN